MRQMTLAYQAEVQLHVKAHLNRSTLAGWVVRQLSRSPLWWTRSESMFRLDGGSMLMTL